MKLLLVFLLILSFPSVSLAKSDSYEYGRFIAQMNNLDKIQKGSQSTLEKQSRLTGYSTDCLKKAIKKNKSAYDICKSERPK